MIEMSSEVNHLFPALISAQSKLRGVVKDSKNPHFKSNYASLENVIDTARGPLHEDGIAFTQAPGALVDGAIEITTMLMHRSGQWLRSTLHIPLQKRDPQGVGSAITYGCRYALMATLGLPPVDDDGESAMDRNPAPSQARVTPANPSLTRTDTGTAGVPLSANAKLMLKAAEMAMTKQDVTDWVRANGEAIDGLPEGEPEKVRDHARALYSRLPEKVAA